jgi:hypothetical protein
MANEPTTDATTELQTRQAQLTEALRTAGYAVQTVMEAGSVAILNISDGTTGEYLYTLTQTITEVH